jgi:FAD/FMN-containing dehydrogenase
MMKQNLASAMRPAMPMETIRLSDWSGLTDFGGTAEVYAPANEGEIIGLVRYCRDNQKKLRVVGLQTSWNALWYTPDVMMTTKNLRGVTDIDPVNKTVTCGAGTTLEVLHKALWDKGLTLDTAPAVDWVTVAGAISTGSHGSGPPSISSSMIGCRLITASGDVLVLREGDERLDAVRISMGALGIMSSVTLRVVDAFYVALKRTRIPETDWKRYITEGEMSYVQWFPHTGFSSLVRVDVLRTKEEADKRASQIKVHAFDPTDPEELRQTSESAPSLTENCQLTRAGNAVLELGNNVPAQFAARNRFIMEVFFQDTEKVGPAHRILMSYQSDPVAGSEWSVPVEKFAGAFADLQKLISEDGYFLPVVWLKKVKAESAWLSAADEECVQCGIYHSRIAGTPDHAREMVYRVERIMLKYGGRPHVGKLISLNPSDVRRVYPNWDKFNTLRRQMDPEGMFWSKLLAASFGE